MSKISAYEDFEYGCEALVTVTGLAKPVEEAAVRGIVYKALKMSLDELYGPGAGIVMDEHLDAEDVKKHVVASGDTIMCDIYCSHEFELTQYTPGEAADFNYPGSSSCFDDYQEPEEITGNINETLKTHLAELWENYRPDSAISVDIVVKEISCADESGILESYEHELDEKNRIDENAYGDYLYKAMKEEPQLFERNDDFEDGGLGF